MVPGIVATSGYSLTDDNPRIVVAEEVVGAEESFSVPSVLLHGFAHLVYCLLHTVGFCEVVILGETSDSAFTAVCGFLGELLAERHIVLACNDKESGYHQALCLGAFSLVLCCLETLVRIPREAVEVEAVVPVGTSDPYRWLHSTGTIRQRRTP